MRATVRVVLMAVVMWGMAAPGHAAAASDDDRINLWPVLYKKGGQLSVLGPLFVLSDDNVALRPLFAVNTEEGKRIRILYPLSEFNPGSQPNWIGPWWWGDDYRVLFPLFWHVGEPFEPGGTGLNALVPLYWIRRVGDNHSLWAPWPLARNTHWNGKHTWWVGPLAGGVEDAEGSYSFWLWPLTGRWTDSGGTRTGDYVAPFYARSVGEDGTMFMTVPWARYASADGRRGWQWLLPVYYSSHSPGGRGFYTLLGGGRTEGTWKSGAIWPLLSWWGHDDEESNIWALAPLFHRRVEQERFQEHALPLYYRETTDDLKRFYSLLYAAQEGPGDNRWKAVIPLYFSRDQGDSRLWATLLGGQRKSADGEAWMIFPLLTWSERTGDEHSFWALAPLIRNSHGPYGRKIHVLPIYYRNDEQDLVASPFYMSWLRDVDERVRAVPLLLSWQTAMPERSDTWILGPLARIGSGKEPGPSHVAPVFYRNPETGTFLSIPWCHAEEGTRAISGIPPLLSWQKRQGPERDLYVAGGLFRRRWGGEPERKASHLIPVYYGRGEDTFVTPLFGRATFEGVGYRYLFTPLAGVFSGDYTGSWLLPFYSRKEQVKTGDVSGSFLWGSLYRRGTQSGASLIPLYRHEREANHPVEGGVRNSSRVRAGLVYHSYRSDVDAADDARDTRYRSHGLWPLYSTMNREDGDRVEQKRSWLWLLSRSRRVEEPGHESVRHSILWKLWDYKREDDTVSVDSFPGITYDREGDGSTRFSLLWRLYRKDVDADGSTKMDIFFIPVKR